MSISDKGKVNVGLLGLGRLGQVYARELAGVIPRTNLVAVADVMAEVAERLAGEFNVPRWYPEPLALLDDQEVEAVVIATPTHTHKDVVVAAAQRHKAILCEKPLSLSLAEAEEMKRAVEQNRVFFHMGFMRRFDRGYAAAKQQIDQGVIGTAVVFRATSRDPSRPSLEYANPKSSGGLIIDAGIHDFDLARWFMGDIKSTAAIGGTLAYPELETVGDIDNAIISLGFTNGRIGVIDLSRNGVYGYDINTEIVGTNGTLRIGYLRDKPLQVMTKNHVAHDAVPNFMQRFAHAYTAQLQNFVECLLNDREPAVTIDDGIEALRAGIAATQAYQSGQTVEVASVTGAR